MQEIHSPFYCLLCGRAEFLYSRGGFIGPIHSRTPDGAFVYHQNPNWVQVGFLESFVKRYQETMKLFGNTDRLIEKRLCF